MKKFCKSLIITYLHFNCNDIVIQSSVYQLINSAKHWQGKTVVNLAHQEQFSKVLSNLYPKTVGRLRLWRKFTTTNKYRGKYVAGEHSQGLAHYLAFVQSQLQPMYLLDYPVLFHSEVLLHQWEYSKHLYIFVVSPDHYT